MNRSRFLVFSIALACAATPLCLLRATTEAEATAGRALVKRYADAIVGIELVVTLKVKSGERELPPQEQRVEVNGTVISPSGLTVTSLARVDPQTSFDAMRAARGGRVELLGADFKEVKLRLANGQEVPARFVLKDADLDLAFMAPERTMDGEKPEFAYVKLDEATEGAVLNTYFYVARASKALQRVPLVRASEVTGIVEKPRRFYLLSEQSLGTPLFDPQGKILGISLQHFANGQQAGIVALPAADIAEMAKQAAAAQAATPAEAPKPNETTEKPAEKTGG